jgi:hypothetical protein
MSGCNPIAGSFPSDLVADPHLGQAGGGAMLAGRVSMAEMIIVEIGRIVW